MVITDRLHGMIFCYITNTPCLVFQNNIYKVRETYEWIKGNKNINLVSDYVEEEIQSFFKQTNFNIGKIQEVSNKYSSLREILAKS